MFEITLVFVAIIISLLLIREAKSYYSSGGVFKIIDDELLFLVFASLPLSIIIFVFSALITKFFQFQPAKNVETNVWIFRVSLIIQWLIWSQLIALVIYKLF